MSSHKSHRRRGAAVISGNPKFYGRHAVYAALDNPERRLINLWGTREEIGKSRGGLHEQTHAEELLT